MANDEVLGPRKTMFVLVIVVGCFAVLWPRILSPLILGNTSEQLKPNKFDREAAVKQERPPIRVGPHPALRERGRAIPPGAPPKPVALPPHIRPPPIPGMRPPLGGPGGPVPAPKSSMGFVMPIYTICIIVFFVYTLSKIMLKRSSSPYDPVLPDPQFRKRVFRDDSRSSPDKLVVSAISGLVAEVRQQMESSAPGLQSQEALDNTHPYTNGTVIHNSGPVQIVTSEYRETKEETPESQEKEPSPKPKDITPEPEDTTQPENIVEEVIKKDELEIKTEDECTDMITPKGEIEVSDELQPTTTEEAELDKIVSEIDTDIDEKENLPQNNDNVDLIKLTEEIQSNVTNGIIKSAEDFVNEERKELKQEEESTQVLLEEAIREESPQNKESDKESQIVKVIGMERTEHPADGGAWRAEPRVVPPQKPHESEQVQSIFLETEIPQQSRVLVTDFKDTPQPGKDSPLVVSGKITLSLIQDTRGTPDRDLESTQDDFTTASAATQPAEKDEELSDEEIEEEIEIEEIEEEVEEEEEEVEEEPKKTSVK